jgi:lipopolysaccharide exporter
VSLRALTSSSFLRNVTVVMSGSAAAQVLSYALMPIIARLYSPSDFGLFGSFQAIAMVIAAAVTLQYSQALLMPKGHDDAANLMAVSFLSVLFVACFCALLVFVFRDATLRLLSLQRMSSLAWILPVAVAVTGANQTLQAWCIRRKAFTSTSVSQVVRTVAASTVQIGSGLVHIGSAGLIGGAIIGDTGASGNLMRLVILRDRNIILSALGWTRMRKLAHEYRDFAFYSTPQNVVYYVSQGIPVIILAHFFGVAVAGLYTLGLRMTQTPMALIRTAVYQVLIQKLSESHNLGNELHPLFVKSTIMLAAVVVLPAIIVFISGPPLFGLILGKKWFAAGEYARWLVLLMIPWFCNIPGSILARVLKQQRNLFMLEVATLVCTATALLVGALFLSPLGTVILSASVGALAYIYLIAWMERLSFRHDRETKLAKGKGETGRGESLREVVRLLLSIG